MTTTNLSPWAAALAAQLKPTKRRKPSKGYRCPTCQGWALTELDHNCRDSQ